MFEFVTWLGHASFRIELSKVIYIDPWKIKQPDNADIILISHPHYDHFNIEDIKKLYHENTTIITVKDVAEKLDGFNVKVIQPGEEMMIDSIKIKAIPAYNKHKDFHPKKNGWIGFLIHDIDMNIYYAGDTDLTSEMENLRDIDLALLPIGGKYTMNKNEAAEAVAIIEPKAVLPYHYGDIVGKIEDFNEFKKIVINEDPDILIVEN